MTTGAGLAEAISLDQDVAAGDVVVGVGWLVAWSAGRSVGWLSMCEYALI